jgi:hypothetical protein
MNRDDFWKQFEGAPRIDCVKMKHDIQAEIYEEIKELTMDQRIAYFRRGSEEFRREMGQRTALPGNPS